MITDLITKAIEYYTIPEITERIGIIRLKRSVRMQSYNEQVLKDCVDKLFSYFCIVWL